MRSVKKVGAGLLVGQPDLVPIESREKPSEGFPLLDRAHSVRGRQGSFQVFLDPGEPAEQLLAEDLRMGGWEVERHDTGVGHRVLFSHEELPLLVVRPSAGVRAPPRVAFI